MHLADSNDEDSLPASNAQPCDSQIVEVFPTQLGGTHCPPAWFREGGEAAVLEHLCNAVTPASERPPVR